MPAQPTRVRYLVMAWMCLFAMVAYVHRGCLAVPAKRIQGELSLSDDQMGLVLSMFLWGYAFMQLPGGWLGDRWGSRLVLPLLMLASALATGLSALVLGMWFLLVCRAVMGAAQAGMFPCAVLTHSRWFPASERAFPNGMLASFMSVGGAASAALAGWLLEFFTWQTVFVLFALPGMALALGFYAWFRDQPAEHSWVNVEELAKIQGNAPTAPAQPVGHAPWLAIATDPRMWLVSGQQFFRAAGYIFYMTWFPTFLQQTHGLSESEAGFYSSFPLLGVVAGSATGGLLTDWLFRRTGSQAVSRKGVAIVSLAACAGFLASAYWLHDAPLRVGWITLASFFAGLCGPAAYTATIDLGGKHVAMVFSVMNMAGNIGAALLPIVIVSFRSFIKEFMLDFMPDGTDSGIVIDGEELLNSQRLERASGWNEVLFFLAALYVAAALCWVFLRMDGGAISARRDGTSER